MTWMRLSAPTIMIAAAAPTRSTSLTCANNLAVTNYSCRISPMNHIRERSARPSASQKGIRMTQTWPHCRILPCIRIKAAPLCSAADPASAPGLALGRPARRTLGRIPHRQQIKATCSPVGWLPLTAVSSPPTSPARSHHVNGGSAGRRKRSIKGRCNPRCLCSRVRRLLGRTQNLGSQRRTGPGIGGTTSSRAGRR